MRGLAVAGCVWLCVSGIACKALDEFIASDGGEVIQRGAEAVGGATGGITGAALATIIIGAGVATYKLFRPGARKKK